MDRKHTCSNLKLFSKLNVGCFFEYTSVPQDMLRVVPPAISDEHCSVLEPLGVSLRAVNEAGVFGEDVLVVGCGPIGLFAVGVARAMGAKMIFASDMSLPRLALAQKMGADVVLNPKDIVVQDEIHTMTRGEGVGIIIETSGNPAAIASSFKSLRSGGKISMVGIPANPVEIDIATDVITREATVIGIYGRRVFRTCLQAEELITSGKLDVSPIITHYFSLEQYEEAFEKASSQNYGKVIFKI